MDKMPFLITDVASRKLNGTSEEILETEHISSLLACIVLPTYNEAKNIRTVLEKIKKVHQDYTEVDIHVLVVDDNSPDGTAGLVKKYQRTAPWVHLLYREKKEGLGAAYISGFSHAREILQPDILLEMDADLSHNPFDIPRLIDTVLDGADFVIGSRYVTGGSLPADWGMKRKFMSKSANIYTKAVLGLPPHDCTGGFRAMHTRIFEKIDITNLNVKGYAFQISLLNAVIAAGFTVKEVPIHFADRTNGESKLRMKDIVELVFTVPQLRMNRSVRHT